LTVDATDAKAHFTVDFSGSPLGRFLYGIGIYILLLYNLYTGVQDFVDCSLISNKRWNQPVASSAQFHGKEAPVPESTYRRPPFRPKSLSLSYLADPSQDIRREKSAGLSSHEVHCISIGDGRYRTSSSIEVPFNSPCTSVFDMARASTPMIRPDSSIMTRDIWRVPTPELLSQTGCPCLDQDRQDSASPTGKSISSMDKLLRHRDEVDTSIVALRKPSRPCSAVFRAGLAAIEPVLASIPTSMSEETPSRNSTGTLSLSKFPDPPIVRCLDSKKVEILTFRPPSRRKRFRISGSNILLPETFRPNSLLRPGKLESTSTQWDVTSFIGSELA
jgi:hypothetical protein